MAQSFEATTLRVIHGGSTLGTGFLVAKNLVVTCAHVVANIKGTVHVQFTAQQETFTAEILKKYYREPDDGDIAFLRIEITPLNVAPLRLGAAKYSDPGNIFQAFGYPSVGRVEGIHARGTILGPVKEGSQDLIQLDSSELDLGHSGAPVLDVKRGIAVGMVVSVRKAAVHDKGRDEAFAIPSETIWQACPEIPHRRSDERFDLRRRRTIQAGFIISLIFMVIILIAFCRSLPCCLPPTATPTLTHTPTRTGTPTLTATITPTATIDIGAKDNYFMLVLDASTGMTVPYGERTKWEAARDTALGTVKRLNEHSNFGLVLIGGKQGSSSGNYCGQPKAPVIPITSEGGIVLPSEKLFRQNVIENVAQQIPRGGGSYSEAIAMAINQLEDLPREKIKTLIFVAGSGDACEDNNEWDELKISIQAITDIKYIEILILDETANPAIQKFAEDINALTGASSKREVHIQVPHNPEELIISNEIIQERLEKYFPPPPTLTPTSTTTLAAGETRIATPTLTTTATSTATATPTASSTSTPSRTPWPTPTDTPITPDENGGGGSGGGSTPNFDRNGDGKVTCADFSTQAEALVALQAGYTSLDGDGDGVPCEGLPP